MRLLASDLMVRNYWSMLACDDSRIRYKISLCHKYFVLAIDMVRNQFKSPKCWHSKVPQIPTIGQISNLDQLPFRKCCPPEEGLNLLILRHSMLCLEGIHLAVEQLQTRLWFNCVMPFSLGRNDSLVKCIFEVSEVLLNLRTYPNVPLVRLGKSLWSGLDSC